MSRDGRLGCGLDTSQNLEVRAESRLNERQTGYKATFFITYQIKKN